MAKSGSKVVAAKGLRAALDGEIQRAHENLIVALVIALATTGGILWLVGDLPPLDLPPGVFWTAIVFRGLLSILAANFAWFFLRLYGGDLSQLRALQAHLIKLEQQALSSEAGGVADPAVSALTDLEPTDARSPQADRRWLH